MTSLDKLPLTERSLIPVTKDLSPTLVHRDPLLVLTEDICSNTKLINVHFEGSMLESIWCQMGYGITASKLLFPHLCI